MIKHILLADSRDAENSNENKEPEQPVSSARFSIQSRMIYVSLWHLELQKESSGRESGGGIIIHVPSYTVVTPKAIRAFMSFIASFFAKQNFLAFKFHSFVVDAYFAMNLMRSLLEPPRGKKKTKKEAAKQRDLRKIF